jgi:DNA topoisomerase VI subunit B
LSLFLLIATEIHQSVKRALQACCQQLRSHLTKRNALKDAKTRRSKLIRYAPDISRSLFGLLDGMRQRKKESDGPEQSDGRIDRSPMKRLRLDPNVSKRFIDLLDQNHINEDTLHSSLVESIDTDPPKLLDSADYNENDDDVCTKATIAAAAVDAVPLYIIPLFNRGDDAAHDICHPIFTFRPIVPLLNVTTDC